MICVRSYVFTICHQLVYLIARPSNCCGVLAGEGIIRLFVLVHGLKFCCLLGIFVWEASMWSPQTKGGRPISKCVFLLECLPAKLQIAVLAP